MSSVDDKAFLKTEGILRLLKNIISLGPELLWEERQNTYWRVASPEVYTAWLIAAHELIL